MYLAKVFAGPGRGRSLVATHGSRGLALVAVIVAGMAVHACAKDDAAGRDEADATTIPTNNPARQWYRVGFAKEGSPEIPLFLELPAAHSGDKAAIATGDWLPRGLASLASIELAADTTWDGTSLVIDFKIYNTKIVATASAPGGELRGNFISSSKSWGVATMPFRATPVAIPDPSRRFLLPLSKPPIDLGTPTTIFKVSFPDSGMGKLVLDQVSPGVFTADLSFQSGNKVFLAGNGRGNAMWLSTFDGTSPYLLTLELATDRKHVSGTWTAGQALEWKETLTGTTSADFELPLKVSLAGKQQRLSVPQLGELRYQGKPYIVELAGGWCATCKVAAPFLVDLYRRYHGKGLEIITLIYEFTDDKAYNQAQAKLFKDVYGITWDVIAVDGSVDSFADIIPSQLKDVDVAGFPIALFVDKKGILRGLHAGFPSPSAKAEFSSVTREFETTVKALLDEP